MTNTAAAVPKIDYGIDAPAVLRNLFLAGIGLPLVGLLLPHVVQLGPVNVAPRSMFFGTGLLFLLEAFAYLHYVKRGKFLHRDFILGLHTWSGNEAVLDVGCGRGLLLIGAAKRLMTGHATGIDVWSTEDLGGNAEDATLRNLQMEGVISCASVESVPAERMTFDDGSFDVVVSNLCLHNIYDKPTRTDALAQIARALKPGGTALLSDYKLTGEYAAYFAAQGWTTERKWGSVLSTFPPMRVVIARKPQTP